jgi:tetratricopeptide (TPR) repeat protein
LRKDGPERFGVSDLGVALVGCGGSPVAIPDRRAISCNTRRQTTPVGNSQVRKLEHQPYRWRDVYVERDELRILMGMWRKVADYERPEEIEPQLAILLADSGFGKTRLVHKFYETIVVRHQQADGTCYWPRTIGRNEDALTINPPFEQINMKALMPFMWWGIQLPDQTSERATCVPVLGEAVKLLGAHLFPMEISRSRNKIRMETGKEALAFLLAAGATAEAEIKEQLTALAVKVVEKLSFLESAKDFFDIGTGLIKIVGKVIDRKQKQQQTHIEREQEKKKALVDEIVQNFSALLNPTIKDMVTVPMVLVVDDAQWIECGSQHGDGPNADLLTLLSQLLIQAKANHWPLMVILTHWEKEWKQLGREKKGIPGMLERVTHRSLHWSQWHRCIIPLRLFDLSAVLEKALPGVYGREDQKIRLIGNIVEGQQTENNVIADNPRYLDEFLKMVYQDANLSFLINRDINNPLVDGWEEKITRELGGMEYFSLVKNRFNNLGSGHRNTLIWSSYQGIEFPEKLTEVIALKMNDGIAGCPWAELENPENLIQRNTKFPGGVSRFPDSVYRTVAFEKLDDAQKEKLRELLRNFLSFWLFYGEFDDGLGGVDANGAEEETLCEIALRVFDEWEEDHADIAAAFALAKLVRINTEKLNHQRANRYALQFAGLPNAVSDTVSGCFVDVIYVLDNLTMHQNLTLARKIAESIKKDCVENAQDGNDVEAHRRLLLSYERLGNVALAQHDLQAAQKFHQESLDVARQLANNAPSPHTWRDLLCAYGKLGDVALAQEDLITAQNWYQEAQVVTRQQAKDAPGPQTLRDHAVSCQRLGDVAWRKHDLKAAQNWYQEALEITRLVANGSPSPQILGALATAGSKLGDIAMAHKDFKMAQTLYNESHEILQQLTSDATSPLALGALAVFRNKLGDVAKSQQVWKTAQDWYEKSLEITRQLTKAAPDSMFMGVLEDSCDNLADIAKAQQDWKTEEKWCQVAVEAICQFAEARRQRNLAHFYERLGEAAIAQQDWAVAQKWIRVALDIVLQLGKEAPSPENLRSLALLYGKLGNVEWKLTNGITARELLGKAIEVATSLSDQEDFGEIASDCRALLDNIAKDGHE